MAYELNWIDRVLANCPSGNCALYIRHAARDSGATVAGHRVTVLSPEDEALASGFGNRLKDRLGKVITAPGSRSQRTAHLILAGAELRDGPIPDSDIGDPSAYCVDEAALVNQLGELPPDIARQALMAGILRERAPWAPADPKSAARRILDKIVSAVAPGKFAVIVAPSVPIAATVALALGKEDTTWHLDCPLSLEGAVIFPDNDGVWLSMGSLSGPSLL